VFVLGAFQGLLGWYMVKSGLVDDPRVSQYRLTAHLALAVLLYGYLFWSALHLLTIPVQQVTTAVAASLRRLTLFAAALVFVTMLSGGFVAGLKAGFSYNTFPTMGGQWIPAGIWSLEPGYRNLFENAATVQFSHRLLAMTTLLTTLVLWHRAIRKAIPRDLRIIYHTLAAAVVMQVFLGISTLLLGVPVALAASHQAGALVVLTIALATYQYLQLASADSGVTRLAVEMRHRTM
jgi:cytochrome c oxidase assembly protein subunit 15